MFGSCSCLAFADRLVLIPYIAGHEVPLVATRIYELAFFTGFSVSSIVYYVLNRLFPIIGAAEKFEEVDVSGYPATRSRQPDGEDGAVESGYGTPEESPKR